MSVVGIAMPTDRLLEVSNTVSNPSRAPLSMEEIAALLPPPRWPDNENSPLNTLKRDLQIAVLTGQFLTCGRNIAMLEKQVLVNEKDKQVGQIALREKLLQRKASQIAGAETKLVQKIKSTTSTARQVQFARQQVVTKTTEIAGDRLIIEQIQKRIQEIDLEIAEKENTVQEIQQNMIQTQKQVQQIEQELSELESATGSGPLLEVHTSEKVDLEALKAAQKQANLELRREKEKNI